MELSLLDRDAEDWFETVSNIAWPKLVPDVDIVNKSTIILSGIEKQEQHDSVPVSIHSTFLQEIK